MTPKEIHLAARALEKEIGPRAEVDVFITQGRSVTHPGWVMVRPYGYIHNSRDRTETSFTIDISASFEDAFHAARVKWSEFHDEAHSQAVSRMALKIIELAAINGTCTDAALRAAGYYDAEIADLGADACAEADRMAANGPFTIDVNGGANGAPDEEDVF